MNAPIIDPLQGDFPEVIDEYLEHGIMKCIAFNRRGTLLAAGCYDGSCVIWDFETRGIAKELKDSEYDSAITSVCWSKYGHRILVSAADRSLTLWDVAKGHKISRIVLEQTPLQVCLHPGSSAPFKCLVCPLLSAPIIVDLNTGDVTVIPVVVGNPDGKVNGVVKNKQSVANPDGKVNGVVKNKQSEAPPTFTPTGACFNKYGDLVYVGNSKGEILIIDYESNQVRALVPVSGGAVIKNIVFSRNGQYLLTNSNDRIIRIYDNLLPVKNELGALRDLENSIDETVGVEKLKMVGSKCLSLFREFQDSITKMHWKVPCFSGDGEWVIGGSASKGEHKIYIWDRAGLLVKILEGPKEALIDLVWHPIHPIIVSVSLIGCVYIWAKDYTENWSAFAPDFKELEENEEYVEREDEFDLNPESEKVKESDVNEDAEVDVTTVDEDPFSDSDMSQEELCFLPAIPCPDVLAQPDDTDGLNSSKIIDGSHFGSPDETGPNEHAVNNASSPLEDNREGTRIRRKRKPSEKGLELQAEKVRKPSSNRLPKVKSKSTVDQEMSNSIHGDDDLSHE